MARGQAGWADRSVYLTTTGTTAYGTHPSFFAEAGDQVYSVPPTLVTVISRWARRRTLRGTPTFYQPPGPTGKTSVVEEWMQKVGATMVRQIMTGESRREGRGKRRNQNSAHMWSSPTLQPNQPWLCL